MAADPTSANKRGQRFLVTGTSGALGAWVVKRLVDEGVDVVAVGSRDDRMLRLVLTSVQLTALGRVETATTDPSRLGAAMNGVTHVVHTDTVTDADCRRDPAGSAVSMIGGLDNVLRAASDTDVVGIAYESSMTVFGLSDGRVGSDDYRTPTTLLGCYTLAKELNAASWYRNVSRPSIGLRTNLVYGPGQDVGLTGTPTRAIAEALGGRRFRLEMAGTADFQFVGDVADALIVAAHESAETMSVVNLRGQVATFSDFAKAVATATGSDTVSDERIEFSTRIAERAPADNGLFPAPLPTTLHDGIRSTLEALRWAPRNLY